MSETITEDTGKPKEKMSEAEMREFLKKWSIKYPSSAVQGTLEQIIKEYGEDAINEVLSKTAADKERGKARSNDIQGYSGSPERIGNGRD